MAKESFLIFVLFYIYSRFRRSFSFSILAGPETRELIRYVLITTLLLLLSLFHFCPRMVSAFEWRTQARYDQVHRAF